MGRDRSQESEVGHDNNRDEHPQQHDELALRDQVGLASLIDQLRDVAHRLMNSQIFELQVDAKSKEKSEKAEQQADHQQIVAVHAQKINLRQVGKSEVRLTSAGFWSRLPHGEVRH